MMIPIVLPPGVVKSDSDYASRGRVNDMNLVRFVAGKAEQMGKASPQSGANLGTGYVRKMLDFRDLNGNSYIAVATSAGLLYIGMSPSYGLTIDATPLRQINGGTLTNPLTTNATNTVSISHTAHGLSSGDWVTLSSTVAIDGITLGNVYPVTSITNANTYVITVPTVATGSTSGGGGTVTYNYPRVTLTNPFDTVISTTTVKVHHTSHGAVTGDYVYISGASSVGGITLAGNYAITKIDANTYNITAGSNATSTVTGGGGTPSIQYSVSVSAAGVGNRYWTLANYGNQLLSCISSASIYVYNPVYGGHSYPLYNAPASGVIAMFVTGERFIFALGSAANLLLVQWPDQSDNTQWTALPTNTANSRTLQNGSFLMGGIAVRDGINLVFTNTACYAFNYTGDNNVYSSTSSSTNTGLICPSAVCTSQDIAFWMAPFDFFMWNGSVQRMPSDDIRDYVFRDLDKANASKCWASANTPKKEIWFGYPSLADNTGECTRYVIYHLDQNCWSIGRVPIGGMLDAGLLNYPFIAWNNTDSGGNQFETYYLDYTPNQLNLTNHFGNGEFTINSVSPTSYITFGPIELDNGGHMMDLFSFYPDFERLTLATSNGVDVTLYTQNYPADQEGSNTPQITSYGPYRITSLSYITYPNNRIDVRLGARLISGKISSSANSDLIADWRMGLWKFEGQAGGARR